jgi:hypothetical protein
MFYKIPKTQSGFINILTEIKGNEEPKASVILHAVYNLIISLDLQTEKQHFWLGRVKEKRVLIFFQSVALKKQS